MKGKTMIFQKYIEWNNQLLLITVNPETQTISISFAGEPTIDLVNEKEGKKITVSKSLLQQGIIRETTKAVGV